MPWLSLLGIGEDGLSGLSATACAALAEAALVFGGRRHLALAAPLIRGEASAWPSPITDALPRLLARRGEKVAVLASGDPFCFGIGGTLARHIPAAEIDCIPAPSSLSLARARLGWSEQETRTITLCGRPLALLRPALQPGARLLVLSADAGTPAAVAGLLCGHGFGGSMLTVLEALGGPDERRRAATADRFDLDHINPLNLIAVEVAGGPEARVIPLAPGLPEALFAHDGQITKSEVRAATLAALAPAQGELLWDIGCGSGSVGIEWMLRHPANRAIGIETRPDRAGRAAANAETLGVPGLEVRIGTAPAALAGLPTPDAIFIGGGAREPGLLDAAYQALRPVGRLVVNSVTLETEALLITAWQAHGGSLTRLSVERLEPVGTLHGFRPAMAVLQWAVTKPWRAP